MQLKRRKRVFDSLFARDRIDEALDTELRAHGDELTDRNVLNGMPRQEARHQALAEIGGIT